MDRDDLEDLDRDEDLLDRLELGEFLGVPRATLAAWAYEGRGPRYYRVGKHVRYRKSELLAWLEENARKPARRAATQ